jgi:aldehyde:ferredoxin oxidoreductase
MAEELYGYVGTLLKIDLTGGTVEKVPTTDYDVDKWIGGRGLGSIIQWLECSPTAGAFDPENVLTLLTGPLTGTMLDGGRTFVQSVSPVGYPDKGSFSRSSFGGAFAPELKFAGYDGIILKGKATAPVYIWINDETVEIRDAATLWGLDNFALQAELWTRHGTKTRVASIGPAGEHLSMHATILTDDTSVTGMGSFGAVMGSKNLKAIAVQGTGSVRIADPQGLLDHVKYTQDLQTRKLTNEEGLPPNPYIGSYIAPLPTKDTDLFKESKRQDSPVRLGYSSCYSCPWGGCGFTAQFNDGFRMGMGNMKCTETIAIAPEVDKTGEYVGRTHYGRLNMQERLGISDSTLWWAGLEPLYTRGILTEENTGMDWSRLGTLEFAEELLASIAYRSTPVGDAIAKGWRYFLCDFIGTSEAIHHYRAIRGIRNSPQHNGGGCGGWYLPGPYLIPGLLRFATSNLCAVDIRCTGAETFLLFNIDPSAMIPFSPEYYGLVDANSKTLFGTEQVFQDIMAWNWDSEWNAPFERWNHQFKALDDSLVFCYIAMSAMGTISNYSETHEGDFFINWKLLKHITGFEITEEWEKEFGQRMYLLERAIKTRQGIARADDELFDEVYEEYAPDNVENSFYKVDTGLTRERYKKLLEDWYLEMGIDVATGIPRRSSYEAAGLSDIADRLEGEYGITLPA